MMERSAARSTQFPNPFKDAAHMAAWADYPEDELPELNINSLNHDIAQARQRLSALLAQFDTGRAVTQGVDTVICGRPNVGNPH